MGTIYIKVPNMGTTNEKVPDMGTKCWGFIQYNEGGNMDIKEIRYSTGLTQKQFAEKFNIPIGTLRRWEYGESKPAPYIVKLIAMQLPACENKMRKIQDNKGNTFYYNRDAGYIVDIKGTKINIQEDLEGVKKQNLVLYAKELFEAYYEIVNKFDKDCRMDKKEDIIWS